MGRREHERVTVVGSYPSKKVNLFNEDLSLGDWQLYLTAGQSFDLEIRPESQYEVCQTKQMSLIWSAFGDSAIANDQNAAKRIAVLTNKRQIGLLIGSNKIINELKYSYGKFDDLATGVQPVDATALYLAQSEGRFDYNDPLVVQFHNLGGTYQKNEPSNLYNYNTVKTTTYLDQTGVESYHKDWNTSDFMSVVSGQNMYFSFPGGGFKRLVFYDAAKVFISENTIWNKTQSLVIPANAAFLKLSTDFSNDIKYIQIVKNIGALNKKVIIRYESERVV